jgi:hypothetical protein
VSNDVWVAELDDNGTPDTQIVAACHTHLPAINWAGTMAAYYYDNYGATAAGDASDAYVVIHSTGSVNWDNTEFYPGTACSAPLPTNVDYYNFSQDKFLFISF